MYKHFPRGLESCLLKSYWPKPVAWPTRSRGAEKDSTSPWEGKNLWPFLAILQTALQRATWENLNDHWIKPQMRPMWQHLITIEPGRIVVNRLVNTKSSIATWTSLPHVFPIPLKSSPAPAQPRLLPWAHYLRAAQWNRNQVWASYTLLNFLIGMFKKKQKEVEINLKNIFYLT